MSGSRAHSNNGRSRSTSDAQMGAFGGGTGDACSTIGGVYERAGASCVTPQRRPIQGRSSIDEESDPQTVCLEQLIEGEVIPRLMMLHQQTQAETAPAAPAPQTAKRVLPAPKSAPAAKAIENFCSALRDAEIDRARAILQSYLRKGHAPQDLMIGLLAPAARLLGKMWEEDETDFVTVTLALSRLQVLFHDLRGMPDKTGVRRQPHQMTMLLSVLPGEQHTFGLHVAAEMFQRAGIAVVTLIPLDSGELANATRQSSYDFVGLSVGSVALLDRLASTIDIVRSASAPSTIRVMVGGPAICVDPALAASLDADCVSDDVGAAIAFIVGSLEEASAP